MINFLRSLFSNVPGTSVTFNTANARKGLRSVPAVAGKVTTMAFKGTGNFIGGVPDIISGCASVVKNVVSKG